MIYHFFMFNADLPFANLFRYITFRSGMAMLTSLIISLLIAPYFIRVFKKLHPKGQPIRTDGPKDHLVKKQGTPTMGGLIILLSLLISSSLWINLANPYIWVVLFVTISLGLLGFLDDYLKVSHNNNYHGIGVKAKLFIQTIVSVIACLAIQKYSTPEYYSHITIPFFKNVIINLSYFYMVFVIIVIVGSSNAVNLTDGLDGLAIMPVTLVAASFAIICYLVGNYVFATYLQIHHVPGVGELTLFCAALIGSSLGFLWYNAPPAKIFMGDTGSLSLGGAIGTIGVITKHEFVLAIIGGLFVLEALSVIIQVYYFKITGGKRFFLMAPLHHHFEKKGWTESQVVIRFWIIATVFALIGLATLKIR
jgi:phospho-N-acetylmuramoyl-pentapeptide-transferase